MIENSALSAGFALYGKNYASLNLEQFQDKEEVDEECARLKQEQNKKLKEEQKIVRMEKEKGKKLHRKQEMAIEKKQRSQEKRKKIESQVKARLELKQSAIQQKELARKEYAERQEKKKQKALQAQKAALLPPPEDDDRKMFVGGLTFADLDKPKKKLDPETVKKAKQQRVERIFKMLEQFGPITKKKDFILSNNHCFVIYATNEGYSQAMQTLSLFEERQRVCKEIRATLEPEHGKDLAKLYSPTPHFYVRTVKAAIKNSKKNANKKKRTSQTSATTTTTTTDNMQSPSNPPAKPKQET